MTLNEIPEYVRKLTELWLSAPDNSSEEEALEEALDLALARYGLRDADIIPLVQDGPNAPACSVVNDRETKQHDAWAEAGGYDKLDEESDDEE